MKNVLVIGASGNIASQVIDMIVGNNDIQLTLFVRNKNRLKTRNVKNARIVEGDCLNLNDVQSIMTDVNIVYANLAGAMLFLVEISGSPKIFSFQDHLYAMILSSLDQRDLGIFSLC